MTAAEHKIIIEKGADFSIDIQVFEDVSVKILNATNDTVTMKLKHVVTQADINAGGAYAALSVGDVYSVAIGTGTVVDASLGKINVLIDKNETASLSTRIVSADVSPFSTEYNYFYDITLVTNTTEDIKVVRGKCAVRE